MNASPRLLTILFADIGSSAALYERVGDAKAHQMIADSLNRMKQAVEQNQGRVLRTVGDSVLASFEYSDQAFLGAQAIQQAHAGLLLSVRVGFHTGSVIPDGGDVYGHAVNIAARVAAFARVDEIMATTAAVDQLSARFRPFVSSGDIIEVRGVPDSIGVHRLQWQEQQQDTAITQFASQPTQAFERPLNLRLRLQYGSATLHLGTECTEIHLGRAEDNQIAVSNDEASRRHAKINYRHGQFILHDESTNGTYVKKSATASFVVRRESIVLDGSGSLSLGVSPDLAHGSVIDFELMYE